MKHKGTTLPSLRELTDIVHSEWCMVTDETDFTSDDAAGIDIRLVVGRANSGHAGEWSVNVGSSDYDQWHGHCASTFLGASEDGPARADSRRVASELLAEVRADIDEWHRAYG